MSNLVRVDSIDDLRALRAAMCKFADTVKAGLDEADAEVRRTASWLTLEQQRYWKRELHKRTEQHGVARRNLNRKKAEKTALGGRYSYVDEEKALALAERRMSEARRKCENVKKWTRLLDEEYFSYKAVAQGLGQAMELDVPAALAQLDGMVAALDAYAASYETAGERAAETGAAEESFARAVPADARKEPAALRGVLFPEDVLACAVPSAVDASLAQLLRVDQDSLARLAVLHSEEEADRQGAVMLDRKAGGARRLCCERATTAGGSEWRIGGVDDAASADPVVFELAALLEQRPELAALLTLGVGTLAILDNGSLESVLDARDTPLWSPDSNAAEPTNVDPPQGAAQ